LWYTAFPINCSTLSLQYVWKFNAKTCQNTESTTRRLIYSSIYIPASCFLIFNTFLFSDYRTRKFMTLFTGASHRVLSWANWIHSTPSSQSPLDPFWPHSSVYTSVFLVVSFLRAIPPKPCRIYTFLSPRRATHLIRLFFSLMILVDVYK
jgi:hypothetical protein